MYDLEHKSVGSQFRNCALEEYNKGTILLQKKQKIDKAYRYLKREPEEFKQKYLNLGNCCSLLDRFDEAWKHFEKANDHNLPSIDGSYGDYAAALGNLGLLAYENGDDVTSERLLRRSIEIDPNYNPGVWNLSLTLLRNYCSGMSLDPDAWPMHTYRFKTVTKHAEMPLWDRVSKVKTLVVLDEQGIGDKVMYGRWIPRLREFADEVIVQAPKSLHIFFTEFRCVESINEIVEDAVGVAFGDLAGLFDLSGGEYLRGKFKGVELEGFNVLVEWAGNPDHKNDRHRSCFPGYISALAKKLPGVNFHNVRPDASGVKGVKLWKCQNWWESCQVIEAMNLVVTVDTSLAHVAGAMGKKVLLMQPRRDTDYRWGHPPTKAKTGMGQEDNLWYPSVRVIENRGWDNMFEIIAERIKAEKRDWEMRQMLSGYTVEEYVKEVEKQRDRTIDNRDSVSDTMALAC